MDLPIVEIIPVLFLEIPLNFLSIKLGSPFFRVKVVEVDLVGKPRV